MNYYYNIMTTSVILLLIFGFLNKINSNPAITNRNKIDPHFHEKTVPNESKKEKDVDRKHSSSSSNILDQKRNEFSRNSDLLYSSFKCIDKVDEDIEERLDEFSIAKKFKTTCVFKNICFSPMGLSYYNLKDDEVNYGDVSNSSSAMFYFYHNSSQIPLHNPPKYVYTTPPCTVRRIKNVRVCSSTSVVNVDKPMPIGVTYVKNRRVGMMVDWCTFNVGHLLIDNMARLYSSQLKLGLEPTFDFQMVSVSPLEPGSLESHFRSGYSRYPMTSLQNLNSLSKIDENNHNSSIIDKESEGLVCFAEVIVGNDDFISNISPLAVISFRNFMLNNWKLPISSVFNNHLIVMFNKSSERVIGRGLINHAEIYSAMKNEFGSKFMFLSFSGMPPSEQAALMLKTTVFISPAGGGSFISLFLTNKAVFYSLDIINNKNESVSFNNGGEYHMFKNLHNMNAVRYKIDKSEAVKSRNPNIDEIHYILNITKLIERTYQAMKAVEIENPSLKSD